MGGGGLLPYGHYSDVLLFIYSGKVHLLLTIRNRGEEWLCLRGQRRVLTDGPFCCALQFLKYPSGCEEIAIKVAQYIQQEASPQQCFHYGYAYLSLSLSVRSQGGLAVRAVQAQ